VKKFFLFFVVAVIGLLGGRCSCDKGPTASNGLSTGAVEARVDFGTVGSLGKTQVITLVKGYLQLSSVGEPTRNDSCNLTGNSQIQVGKIFSDLKVKTWQLKAWSVDSKGVVIHSDSTTYTVIENDTGIVSLSLAAKCAQMPVQIYPLSDSVKRAVVIVNGAKVIDTIFGKNSGIDTLKLGYDYLLASSAGIVNTISMKLYGDWIDQDTLLWTGQDTVLVKSGIDISKIVPLLWVGPKIGGLDITNIFGKIGTVTAYGIVQARPKILVRK
jgi:hypothetical protein